MGGIGSDVRVSLVGCVGAQVVVIVAVAVRGAEGEATRPAARSRTNVINGPGTLAYPRHRGGGRSVPFSAEIDVVARGHNRPPKGIADALHGSTGVVRVRERIGGLADWQRVVTWSRPTHSPFGRAHLSNSAMAAGRRATSMRSFIGSRGSTTMRDDFTRLAEVPQPS